jgi:hypothetical protein
MDWLKLFCRVEDYIFGDKLFILFYLLDSQGNLGLDRPTLSEDEAVAKMGTRVGWLG